MVLSWRSSGRTKKNNNRPQSGQLAPSINMIWVAQQRKSEALQMGQPIQYVFLTTLSQWPFTLSYSVFFQSH